MRVDHTGHELVAFSTLIHPGRPVGATAVHHITDDMVCDAPTFPEIAPAILAWMEGTVIVAHNAGFEDSFLSAELRPCRLEAAGGARAGHSCAGARCRAHRQPQDSRPCASGRDHDPGPTPHSVTPGRRRRCFPNSSHSRTDRLRWQVPMTPLGGHLSGRYCHRESLLAAAHRDLRHYPGRGSQGGDRPCAGRELCC